MTQAQFNSLIETLERIAAAMELQLLEMRRANNLNEEATALLTTH